MARGIIRSFDNLGRVTIPKEMRRALRWKDGQAVEVILDYDGVTIVSPQTKCSCCKTNDTELIEIGGIDICKECLPLFVQAGEKYGKE